MIIQEGEKFILKSKDGTKHLGTFSSRRSAQEREKQIEYFKKKPLNDKRKD